MLLEGFLYGVGICGAMSLLFLVFSLVESVKFSFIDKAVKFEDLTAELDRVCDRIYDAEKSLEKEVARDLEDPRFRNLDAEYEYKALLLRSIAKKLT